MINLDAHLPLVSLSAAIVYLENQRHLLALFQAIYYVVVGLPVYVA